MRAVLVTMICIMPGLTGCFGSGCGNNGPVLDTCDEPARDTMLASLDFVRPAGPGYAPVFDFDVIPFIYGGQGLPMIDVYLRMTGDVPGCLDQLTEVRGPDGTSIASDSFAHNTYAQSDGSYVTKGIFLVMSEQWYGELVRVVIIAGGRSVVRQIYVETDTIPDAGGLSPDAPTPDAAPISDAAVNDAAVNDAAVNDATIPDAAVNDAMMSP